MEKNAVKNVTKLPDCFLTIKGKFDGRRGDEELINTYVSKLWHRNIAFEKDIIRIFEKHSKGYRIQGAEALSFVNEKTKDSPTTNVGATRSLRRNVSTKKQLIDLNQEIIDQNSCLQKTLQKQKSIALAKIKAYIFGVKKRMPLYCLEDLCSSSYDEYVERHSLIDGSIAEYANQFV